MGKGPYATCYASVTNVYQCVSPSVHQPDGRAFEKLLPIKRHGDTLCKTCSSGVSLRHQ